MAQFWTEREDEILRKRYGRKYEGKLPACKIAPLLNRTVDSVKMRVVKLNLGRKRYGPVYRGGLKLCRKCQQYKLPSDFAPNKRASDRLHSWCRTCHLQYSKVHSHKTRDRRYSLTAGEWQAMHDAQSGKCAICAGPIAIRRTRIGEVACVDHDHDTGLVRGLLCTNCNGLLGFAHDNVDVLKSAIVYLWRSRLKIRETG
jgi:hypothetical protein